MPAFLLEVGTEELPASFVSSAIQQWRDRIPQSLDEYGLERDDIKIYGTPRRLAVLITGLPSQQSDRTEEVKGPPAQAAFKDGNPTPAALGFAKKQGVDVAALEIRPTDKGDFVFINKLIPGRPINEILSELVPQWIFNLEGKRLMRWGDGDLRFSRPIRWLVALLDDAVLPMKIENGKDVVISDRLSRGHRVLHPADISIPHAQAYVESLRSGYIMVDGAERAQVITEQTKAAAARIGGRAEIYPDLLAEVVNLVEWPNAVVGKFEPEYLELPTEVITTVMVTHQRYFPVFKQDQELLPNFITISNGDPSKADIIADGNARVIRARLADGQYFYDKDLEKPLENLLPKLETVTFQEDLGSLRAKVDRICHIASLISQQLQLGEPETNYTQRAALLCKADLVSQMVYEFPELQGVMGEKYARKGNEPEPVAIAIFEHYLPRHAGDILPQTRVGQIVAIADKLDTLVSIFGLGMIPSGSSDPFALRRAANAIINITWAGNLPLNLLQLIHDSATAFAQTYHKNAAELITLLQDFFCQRLRTLLQEEHHIDYDLVNAVIGDNDTEYTQRALSDVLDVRQRATYLQQIRENGTLGQIYEPINRSTRLATQGDLDTQTLDPQNLIQPPLFQKTSEEKLYTALVNLLPQTQTCRESRNYQQLVTAFLEIQPTVSNFFDGEDSVLVMDENPDIRRNRLNLLGLLRNHARVLADFGCIVKNQ